MLSIEKAKFKSALESTKSQIKRERALKRNPIQTRGVVINCQINRKSFLMPRILKERELMTFFRNDWLMVSQMLVATIKRII